MTGRRLYDISVFRGIMPAQFIAGFNLAGNGLSNEVGVIPGPQGSSYLVASPFDPSAGHKRRFV